MKSKDIRAMAPDEMKAKIADLQRELSIEYGTKATAGGKSRNYGKIRTARRTIARMLTHIRAKELGIKTGKTEAPVAKAAAKTTTVKPAAAKTAEKK